MKKSGGKGAKKNRVAADLFPAFNDALNKKGELVPERKKNASRCSLILQKHGFFFNESAGN